MNIPELIPPPEARVREERNYQVECTAKQGEIMYQWEQDPEAKWSCISYWLSSSYIHFMRFMTIAIAACSLGAAFTGSNEAEKILKITSVSGFAVMLIATGCYQTARFIPRSSDWNRSFKSLDTSNDSGLTTFQAYKERSTREKRERNDILSEGFYRFFCAECDLFDQDLNAKFPDQEDPTGKTKYFLKLLCVFRRKVKIELYYYEKLAQEGDRTRHEEEEKLIKKRRSAGYCLIFIVFIIVGLSHHRELYNYFRGRA